LHYLTVPAIVSILSKVFGHGMWSYSVVKMSISYVDRAADNKGNPVWGAGTEVTGRFTLKTPGEDVIREAVGFSYELHSRAKGLAITQAYKIADIIAFKRGVRLIGDVIGGCLQDEKYLAFLKKVNSSSTLI
jgi:recombination DNA repair RAD52 pathway protein